MPHHKSAKKRVKQTATKSAANRAANSATRSAIKSVREAISANDKTGAAKLLVDAQTKLATLAKKGVIKANNASRRTSRLAAQINKL